MSCWCAKIVCSPKCIWPEAPLAASVARITVNQLLFRQSEEGAIVDGMLRLDDGGRRKCPTSTASHCEMKKGIFCSIINQRTSKSASATGTPPHILEQRLEVFNSIVRFGIRSLTLVFHVRYHSLFAPVELFRPFECHFCRTLVLNRFDLLPLVKGSVSAERHKQLKGEEINIRINNGGTKRAQMMPSSAPRRSSRRME